MLTRAFYTLFFRRTLHGNWIELITFLLRDMDYELTQFVVILQIVLITK